MKTLLSLLLLPSALCAGITLQSLLPMPLEPGDELTVRFEVDAPGTGGVWIDGTRRCIAETDPWQAQSNSYVCKLIVPFGGTVPIQIRFNSGTGEQTLDANVFAASLAIVKTQPEQPEMGRSALFFVRLGLDQTDTQPAPTGSISVRKVDGAEMCRIELPGQTFCQSLMSVPGRNEYIAHYSGDSQYLPLESAQFAVLTKKPGLTTPQYRNADPSLPSIGTRLFLPPVSPNGRIAARPFGQITSTEIGTSYFPFNQWSFGFRSWDTDYSIHHVSGDYVSILTPRAEIFVGEIANLVHIYPDRSRLLQTSAALVSGDTNAADDLYVLDSTIAFNPSGPAPLWVSHKPDGSAAPGGVNATEMVGNSRTYMANQPGFFIAGGSQTDVMIDTPGLPLRRVPGVENSFLRIHALSSDGNFALLSSRGALIASDTNARNDIYQYSFVTQSFTRISTDADDLNPGANAAIAPDNSIVLVFRTENDQMNVVMWFRADGTVRRYTSDNFGNQIKVDANFVLSGAYTASVQLNLISGEQRLNFPARLGDERLLNGQRVLISADGTTLALSSPVKVIKNGIQTPLAGSSASSVALSLNADGRRLLLATPDALVSEDVNTLSDVYAWHPENGRYELLSLTPAGTRPLSGVQQVYGAAEAEGLLFYGLSASDLGLSGANQTVRLDLNTRNAQILPAPEANCVPDFTENRWILWRCTTNNLPTFYRGDGLTGQTMRLTLANGIRPQSFTLSGDSFVFQRFNGSESQAALYELATGGIRELASGSSARFSTDGRFALVPQLGVTSDDGGQFSYYVIASLTVVDLVRNLQMTYPTLSASSYALSGNGCQFASIGRTRGSGMQTRANPFCKEPSYVAVVRTLPNPLTYADKARIDVFVNHKSAGASPTGVVRVTGAGGQCDAILTPQGTAAIGRCELKIGRKGAPEFEPLPLFQAQYFGDLTYGNSESTGMLSIAKRPLNIRFEVDPAAQFIPGVVRVRAQIQNIAANQPFRGVVMFRHSQNTACTLSAKDIRENRYCEFYANSTIIQPIIDDPNYTGQFMVGFQNGQLLKNGFENF